MVEQFFFKDNAPRRGGNIIHLAAPKACTAVFKRLQKIWEREERTEIEPLYKATRSIPSKILETEQKPKHIWVVRKDKHKV